MTAEDVLSYAKSVGVELTDEQLDAVSGGGYWSEVNYNSTICPWCNKKMMWPNDQDPPTSCPYCGHTRQFAE